MTTNNEQKAAVQAVSQNPTAVKKMFDNACDYVLDNVNTLQESGQITLPTGYHAGNALKSAWLYLQTVETRDHQKAIDVCTKSSICNALLEMVTKGEHPKQHGYFIPTGTQLTYWERYTGKLMRAKRDAGIETVNAQVVYEGDNFVYTVDDEGNYQLVKHETNLDNIDTAKIKAAYAVVVTKHGKKYLEVMTMAQMRKAWMQGAAKGNSGAHTNFTDQMAKRTIINRACKVALDSATETEGDDDFMMVPPSQAEAMRDAANALPANDAPRITAVPEGGYDEEPSSFEEVGTQDAPAMRDCPV